MSRSIVNKPVNCQKMYYGSVCVLAEMVTLRPCGYTCPLTVAAWRSASPLPPCGSEKSNLSTLISERLFNLLSTIVQPRWYHAALSCLQYTFCSYSRCSFYVSITSCKMEVTTTLSWGQLWNRWTTVSFSRGGICFRSCKSHCDVPRNATFNKPVALWFAKLSIARISGPSP